MNGTLYIVPTPIGNLSDITLHVLDLLKKVDLIACEDTRTTLKLLNYYNISKPLTSFYERNRFEKIPYIISQIKSGKDVAVVSESGTPGISDPGFFLVKEAIEKGVNVVSVPGASALTTALAGSGLPTDGFIFLGFLPRKRGKIKNIFKKIIPLEKTIIFYESPHRVKNTLKILSEVFPAETDIVIARELTKKFEEFIRGKISNINEKLPKKILGEITVLLSMGKK